MRTDKPDPATNEEAVAILRISVKDPDEKKVGRAFSNAVTELALATIPGFFGVGGGPSAGRPFGVYEPALVPADTVPQEVVLLGGETRRVESRDPDGAGARSGRPPSPTRQGARRRHAARAARHASSAPAPATRAATRTWASSPAATRPGPGSTGSSRVERLRELLPEVADPGDRSPPPARAPQPQLRDPRAARGGRRGRRRARTRRRRAWASGCGRGSSRCPRRCCLERAHVVAEAERARRMRFPGVRAPQAAARARDRARSHRPPTRDARRPRGAAHRREAPRAHHGPDRGRDELLAAHALRHRAEQGRAHPHPRGSAPAPHRARRVERPRSGHGAPGRAAHLSRQRPRGRAARDRCPVPGVRRRPRRPAPARRPRGLRGRRSPRACSTAPSRAATSSPSTRPPSPTCSAASDASSRDPEVAALADQPPKATADALAEIILRGLERAQERS